MNSNPVTKFHKDKSLIFRMYFTIFMLGILYEFFLFLLASGVPVTFIVLIVGGMVVFQYYTSDNLY